MAPLRSTSRAEAKATGIPAIRELDILTEGLTVLPTKNIEEINLECVANAKTHHSINRKGLCADNT